MVNLNQLLAPTPRLEEFITEIVNLPLHAPGPVTAFVKRFADFGLFDQRLLQALTKTIFKTNRAEVEAMIGRRLARYNKLKDLLLESEISRISSATDAYPHYIEDFNIAHQEKVVEAHELKRAVEKTVVPYLYQRFNALWNERDEKTRQWGLAIFRTGLADIWDSDSPHLSIRHLFGVLRLPKPPEELPIETAFEFLVRQHHRTRQCLNPDCPKRNFLAKRHSQRYCSERCAQSGERKAKRKWWAEHGSDRRKGQKQATTTKKRTRKKRPQKGE